MACGKGNQRQAQIFTMARVDRVRANARQQELDLQIKILDEAGKVALWATTRPKSIGCRRSSRLSAGSPRVTLQSGGLEKRSGEHMSRQASFADLEYASKKRRAHREVFLAKMAVVVPGAELLARLP